MSKKSKSRALRQSDTRRAQLERRLRIMTEELRIADEGTAQLRVLCTATITHVLLEAGITDIIVPEVNAAEVMEKWLMSVERAEGNKLHITITKREKDPDQE